MLILREDLPQALDGARLLHVEDAFDIRLRSPAKCDLEAAFAGLLTLVHAPKVVPITRTGAAT